jgi:hypothetical protein
MTTRRYPYNRSKPAQIHVRTTPSRKREIKAKAAQCNMFVSDYLVHASLNLEIPQLPNKISREFINQLSRIGNNLNQLTRVGHLVKQQLTQYSDDELAELLDEQNELLTAMFEELKSLRASKV